MPPVPLGTSYHPLVGGWQGAARMGRAPEPCLATVAWMVTVEGCVGQTCNEITIKFQPLIIELTLPKNCIFTCIRDF